MNPDRSVCVGGGRKPFVLMATEKKCCQGSLTSTRNERIIYPGVGWYPLTAEECENFQVEQFPESFTNKRLWMFSAKKWQPHQAAE